METLAQIYMGTVTSWDDPALQQDNPEAGSVLPAEPIQVLVEAAPSESTRLLTAALGRSSAAFLAWMRARLLALAPSNDEQARAEAQAATETDLDFWPQTGAGSHRRVQGEGQMEAIILDGDFMLGYLQQVGEIRAEAAALLVQGQDGQPNPVTVSFESLQDCVSVEELVNASVNGTI